MRPNKTIRGARVARSLAPVLMLLAVSAAAFGQEAESEQALIPMTEEESVVLDALLEKIESNRVVVASLTARLNGTDGV